MTPKPLSDLARAKLRDAAQDPRGAKLSGRSEKKAADELATRGLVQINKSRSRAKILPAGQFVLPMNSHRPRADGADARTVTKEGNGK